MSPHPSLPTPAERPRACWRSGPLLPACALRQDGEGGSWAPRAGGCGASCPLGIGSHSGYPLGFPRSPGSALGGRRGLETRAEPALRPAAPRPGVRPRWGALTKATMERACLQRPCIQRPCIQRPRAGFEALALRSGLKARSGHRLQGRSGLPGPASPPQHTQGEGGWGLSGGQERDRLFNSASPRRPWSRPCPGLACAEASAHLNGVAIRVPGLSRKQGMLRRRPASRG